jgi:phospholipase/carboxylesterase
MRKSCWQVFRKAARSHYTPRCGTRNGNNTSAQPQGLPIFMAHGSFDPMLPMALGQHSQQVLENAGYAVEWHDYPMAHAVCPEEIADIRTWLLSVFG